MSQKVAVAIIHGIGVPDPQFADELIDELRERLARLLAGRAGDPAGAAVFRPVLWAPVLQGRENTLWEKIKASGSVDFVKLRRFMIDFAADALAYQPTPHDQGAYIGVHRLVAQAIKALAAEAGPKAPLVIIAHSLGSVIASNYLYDLQMSPKKKLIRAPVRRAMGRSALDKGETLAALFTLGSPLALWSMRYDGFGVPIDVPSPKLRMHYPRLSGEWLNLYDPSDVIGYPLGGLNSDYAAVVHDKAVNAGSLLTSWNPASHIEYWTDNDVTVPIAESLARIWQQANA
jgi:hypothetical protein